MRYISNNRRLIHILGLSTLFSIFAITASLLFGRSLRYESVYIFVTIMQIYALRLMTKGSIRKGFRIYLSGVYMGILYYTLIRLDMQKDSLIFITIIVILTVLTTFLYSFPVSHIFALLNYLLLSYKFIFDSSLTTHRIIFELAALFILFFILLEARLWVDRLNKKNIESLKSTQKVTLQILASVSEIKDKETDNHLKRVEIIVCKLVQYLKKEKKYGDYISSRYLHDIGSAAYLHDIGKIGISDRILNKQGPLTKDEKIIIQNHTVIGHELIREASKNMQDESIFSLALEIARHHHEKWDGTGYPDNLSGSSIPLSARILAIVDVYDALISKRPYKKAFPHEKAIKVIQEGSGTHFDPEIVKVFTTNSNEIFQLIKEYL